MSQYWVINKLAAMHDYITRGSTLSAVVGQLQMEVCCVSAVERGLTPGGGPLPLPEKVSPASKGNFCGGPLSTSKI